MKQKPPKAPPAPTAEPTAPGLIGGGASDRKVKSLYPEAFDGLTPPKQLWHSRRIGNKHIQLRNGKSAKGVLHVCGRGSKTAQVMFLSPAVYREEEMTMYSSEPAMLNGPAGAMFMRFLFRCGFKDDEWYYTSLCKYNVERLKPSSQDIRWNMEILLDEIKTIKPKIIVCLGKMGFDQLYKLKFKLSEVQGGFFRSDEHDCLLYPMDTLLTPLMKPEYQERMLSDLKIVRRALDELQGHTVVKMATNYTTIDTAEKLQNCMSELQGEVNAGRVKMAAVDCEWHGQTAWGGRLRSMQLSWKSGQAVYMRFGAPVKGKFEYVFDQPLPVVREIIKPTLNDRRLQYIGHSAHADMAWMSEHLELDTFGRFAFDTLFAMQLLNEYSDLKLERLAVQLTDLGRYDLDLLIWKKKTKFDEDSEAGYGMVPDEILIPYGCRDTDATMRLYPILLKKLIQERLFDYYRNFTLPFVTDGFHELMCTGIPMDRIYLDEMRDVYTHHGNILLEEFRKAVKTEANLLFMRRLQEIAPKVKHTPGEAAQLFLKLTALSKQAYSNDGTMRKLLQDFCQDALEFSNILPVFMHWLECPKFNISSADQKKRWLFDVKRLTPLKTTKKDGITMAWEKVMTFPPERRAQFQPAADKQTLKVFAAKDAMVARVEELTSVKNITKAFLKEKDDQGREQGLHSWIQPDERIHSNFALTETGRPRCWQPNILNWPKAITKPIEKAFERINILTVKADAAKTGLAVEAKQVSDLRLVSDSLAKDTDREDAGKRLLDSGFTQEQVAAFVRLITKPVSLRSSATAPEGHAIVDMDLKTAEVVGLGYLSGDTNLINVLTEPDTQFARIDKDNPKKSIRICYNENVAIPESARDPSLLVPLDDPRILRDADGRVMHPLRDVHWEMAEETADGPREKLDERLYRDGSGKVGNFSIPYGATDSLLERMIEANTGIKPPLGTGAKMLETYAKRYPVAWEYQKSLERMIEDPGYFRALSGRVRHFFFNQLEDTDGMSDYTKEGILSPLKRQARNFPMQNIVADTTNKALTRFVKERNERRLKSRIMMLLYDALSGIIPFGELKEAIELMKNCMTIWCPWTAHGRTFNFDVDISVGFRWGVKPTKEEKQLLKQYL